MSPADEPDETKEPEITKTPEPIVEPTPPVTVEDIASLEERRERRWLMLIVYFLMALAVAILVVFGGRWAYRAITHNDKPATTNQPAGNNVPQQPSPTPSTPATPTPQPTTTPSQTTQTTQLPNNGPGDIAAIFIGTTVIVGGLHFIYNLRKQN